MNVIGVIDLLEGRAVHARGGARERYRAVHEAAGIRVAGDAAALMDAYLALGVKEIYLADLDAILGRPPQDDRVSTLARRKVPLWLDAGVSSAARAAQLCGLGISRVVVGLETLDSFEALAAICRAAGTQSTAFSLDLRAGELVAPRGLHVTDRAPDAVAARAAAAGAGSIIVLDLARVGSGCGPDLALLERIRRSVPGVTLVAGGGIRGQKDLSRLADAGCDAALVATALLSGSLRLSK